MDDPPSELKVFVSRRAHESDEPPRFLYREAPDAPWDSGWRAVAGDESRAEADDPAHIVLESVGALVERWPELRVPFAAGAFARTWGWSQERHEYVVLPEA